MTPCQHLRLEFDSSPDRVQVKIPPEMARWMATEETPSFSVRCLECGWRFQLNAPIELGKASEVP